jgi:2',3'-cyclic-nucleotide 2'-phosphodiesterase
MRILFIGDIVGSPGRQIVRDRLADLVTHRQIDLVIANGENSASGFGITPKIADDLLAIGVDVITGGNHSWDRKEILEYMPHQPRLLRPGNFPEGSPGSGTYVGTANNGVKFAVLNLQGRVFLPAIDDPFRKVDAELGKLPDDVAFVFVDMHAETTSEKQAMGYFCDGRATMMVGTHTHAPTADLRILPGGTAFMSDVGMTGDYDSVIGMNKEEPLQRFLRRVASSRFEPASGPGTLCGIAVETDTATGLATRAGAVRVGGCLEPAVPAFWS